MTTNFCLLKNLLLCLYLGPFKYTIGHEQTTIFLFSGAKTNHLV